MIRPQTVIPIDPTPVLRSGEPRDTLPYRAQPMRRFGIMRRRKLIGLLERTILGTILGAALFALERRLNRKGGQN
jgi:hypothetical protein